MAAFYLDHNVAFGIAQFLQARGHRATTARSIGLDTARDDEHFLKAAEQGWILVTHDWHDFFLLHDAWLRWSAAWQVNAEHSGILTIPQHGLSFARAAEELSAFVALGLPLVNELYRLRLPRAWYRRVFGVGWDRSA